MFGVTRFHLLDKKGLTKIHATFRYIVQSSQYSGRFRTNNFHGMNNRLRIPSGINRNGTSEALSFIQIRPNTHLFRALGFFVLTGVGTFSWSSFAELRRIQKGSPTGDRSIYSYLNEKWSSSFEHQNMSLSGLLRQLTPAQKITFWVIAVNVAVYAAWRIPNITHFMYRYFTSSLASKSLCLPMLLSAFSHHNLLHLVLNMYVLQSFAIPLISRYLGPEQFIAFYLTSAVFASLTSLLHKSFLRWPQRALGASGAIFAALSYACTRVPDLKLSIIFLPMFTFSAQTGLFVVIMLDTIGLIAGWRVFDHAAHLGGALFGMFYAAYGEKLYRTFFQPYLLYYVLKQRTDNSSRRNQNRNRSTSRNGTPTD